MKPMLPSLTYSLPTSPGWVYEVKYDGFRAILNWNTNGIELTSRNGKPLLPQFPEIKDFLLKHENQFKPFLPLQLDGELVYLENPYKGNFSTIQVRGRLKSKRKIIEEAQLAPCRLMVFDALMISGRHVYSSKYSTRKEALKNLFKQLHFYIHPDPSSDQLLQYIDARDQFDEIWENVVLFDGEGIVAKQQKSIWEEGKRSTQWLKYKNWKYVSCFVTAYEKSNGYFYIGVYNDNEIHEIGQVLFGLKPEEKQALKQIIKQNMLREDQQFIYVQPAICLEIKYLEIYNNQLREPHFDRFRFDLTPSECTYQHFQFQQKNITNNLEITHPDKPLWKNFNIQKADFVNYLREVSSYMLPFLKDRLLTVIRFPHGMDGEAFYQKNCPEYAPSFVQTYEDDGIHYLVCNQLKTLIWLGNQLAIEFHIPFQTIKNNRPSEIVFDLDPPSIDAFPLAIKAALLIKEVLDQLKMIGFVKTSGNKGLQIYIPLPENVYSYDDTRLFTSFMAEYLVTKDPDSFTIERMKKNRGNRLYVDYVQHSEGKTIIAPYSMRGNKHAGVATPLYWEEINNELKPEMFNMQFVLNRIKMHIDPFKNYFYVKNDQPFQPILDIIKKKE
jgi:bifunctional non-homologous end joining protein LigD